MDGFIGEKIETTGPKTELGKWTFDFKYKGDGEDFGTTTGRVAATLADNEEHREAFIDHLRELKTVPGGRIWSAAGSPRMVTCYNCFVSGTILDSLNGPGSIMQRLVEASITLQQGGGIGYDFSLLRPEGDPIKTLGARSSGPLSFMDVYDKLCGTIESAGIRRGAQMGTMRCDHPDILKFISAKANMTRLRNFNISVAVTDILIKAVKEGTSFNLIFNDKIRDTVDASNLWDTIMRMTYSHAEPGVAFIDRVNKMNNLYYCEEIATSNPCGEQFLPPFGACLLGSLNLTAFIKWDGSKRYFDWSGFIRAIHIFVAALDNVIDTTIYPLPEQELEAKAKRRMGIGVLGVANALEALGFEYGTNDYIEFQNKVAMVLRNECYRASALRSKEKGAFPLFDRDKYLNGEFIKTLPDDIRDLIYRYGIRNSHLTSIAPTGTISLLCDNVSSGIEPVFAYEYERDIKEGADKTKTVLIQDYGVAHFGVYGKRAYDVAPEDHVRVAAAFQQYVDSAVSKTVNVPRNTSFKDFVKLYMLAYDLGAKGITTYRDGNREGVLRVVDEGSACTIDPMTGAKTCS